MLVLRLTGSRANYIASDSIPFCEASSEAGVGADEVDDLRPLKEATLNELR
jgi:hypothetical protein